MDPTIIFNARLQSRAKNTIASYKSGFNHWRNFALENNLTCFPVNNTEFNICILEMIKNNYAWPTINSTLNAINFFHQLFFIEPIKTDKFVLDYCKRFARKVDRRKRPLLKHEFSKIVRTGNEPNLSLLALRDLCIIIFGFFGFLRYDDLSQLRLSDVDIFGPQVTIVVPESKADQNYKSQKVQFKLDPRCSDIVRRYVKYSKFALLGWHRNDVFFFMKFSHNKPVNVKLPYKDCRTCVLKLCEKCGIDSKELGTHSLRIGGCSEASRSGVPDYLLDLHGRWAFGSTARAGYQRLTPAEKDLVSSKLRLG